MALALRYVAHSEIGLVRKNNQDSAYVSPTMLMVADGMGGAAAGDLASAIAVRELQLADGDGYVGAQMMGVLGQAISRASDAMNALIAADPKLDGMGSTVCGVMFDGAQLALANIGDSRAYRYRDGELTRLSRDHSWVQSLIDEGRITEAEALEHPHRSLILRVINGQPQHVPDLSLVEAKPGDRLLICSDGLCGMVTDDVIAERMDGERGDVLASLVRLAHLEGGQDNITIIIADIVEGEPEGVPQIYGAADLIDLDGVTEQTLAQPTSVAASNLSPRPDPAAGEHARYAPVAKRRGSTWLKLTLAILLPLIGLGAAGTIWYSYTQGQFYLGANDTKLAIFQGVPEPVFNLPLSHVVQADDTLVSDLPPYYQEQVRQTIRADSLAAAQLTLGQLRTKAKDCIAERTQWHTPTATASASAGLPMAASSTAKASATASTTPKSVVPSSLASPTPGDTSTPAAPTEC